MSYNSQHEVVGFSRSTVKFAKSCWCNQTATDPDCPDANRFGFKHLHGGAIAARISVMAMDVFGGLRPGPVCTTCSYFVEHLQTSLPVSLLKAASTLPVACDKESLHDKALENGPDASQGRMVASIVESPAL